MKMAKNSNFEALILIFRHVTLKTSLNNGKIYLMVFRTTSRIYNERKMSLKPSKYLKIAFFLKSRLGENK